MSRIPELPNMISPNTRNAVNTDGHVMQWRDAKTGLPTVARSDERRLVPVVRLELTRLFTVPGF